MAVQIQDCWEQYSTEEFKLRKSLLADHVACLATHNEAYSEKVNINFYMVTRLKINPLT